MVDIKTIIEELKTNEICFMQDETHEPMTTEGELLILLEYVANFCPGYKHPSKVIELPYSLKPKDKVWYILKNLSERDLKDYKYVVGDCAVGNIPDTVIDVCTMGFWVNCLPDRNEDYLVPEDCDFVSWDEIGKSYFLTREEAKDALKKRGKTMNNTQQIRVKRLRDNGYRPVHLFKSLYLVRNYSKKHKKFSLYGIMKIK